MTIDEFIQKLSETPRNWELDGYSIRYYDNNPNTPCYCPLTYIAGIPGISALTDAQKRLNLSYEDACKIIDCADYKGQITSDYPSDFNLDLRQRMLEACGLTEETQENTNA